MSSKTQRPSTSHTSSTDEWYVRRETEVLGPYSLAQLAEQFQSGRLTDFDIARQGRHGAWQRIGELPLTKMAAALDATIPDVSLISPRTAPLVTPPVETFGTSAKPTESKPPPSRPAPSQTLHRPDKTPSAPSRPSASPADYVVWSASMQWEPPREAEAPLAEMHDASLWLKGPVEPTTPAAPNEVFAQELPAQVASDSEKSVPSEIRADLTDREEVASPHVPLPAAEALPSPTAEAASVEPSPGEEIPQAGRVDASLWLRGPVSAPPPEMAPHAPDGPQASDVPPTELPEAERQDASLWLRNPVVPPPPPPWATAGAPAPRIGPLGAHSEALIPLEDSTPPAAAAEFACRLTGEFPDRTLPEAERHDASLWLKGPVGEPPPAATLLPNSDAGPAPSPVVQADGPPPPSLTISRSPADRTLKPHDSIWIWKNGWPVKAGEFEQLADRVSRGELDPLTFVRGDDGDWRSAYQWLGLSVPVDRFIPQESSSSPSPSANPAPGAGAAATATPARSAAEVETDPAMQALTDSSIATQPAWMSGTAAPPLTEFERLAQEQWIRNLRRRHRMLVVPLRFKSVSKRKVTLLIASGAVLLIAALFWLWPVSRQAIYEELQRTEQHYVQGAAQLTRAQLSQQSSEAIARLDARVSRLERVATSAQAADRDLIWAWKLGLRPLLEHPAEPNDIAQERFTAHMHAAQALLAGPVTITPETTRQQTYTIPTTPPANPQAQPSTNGTGAARP